MSKERDLINFKISVPSTLSLFGEHAVKHKKRALTACVELRTMLTFYELPLESTSNLTINFPQINLFYQVPITIFLKFSKEYGRNIDSLHERVRQFTEYPYESECHKMIVQTFYYLLVLMKYKECIGITPFTMHLSTAFTMDGQYVFESSFTVCLAACLLRWARLQKGPHYIFSEADLNTIQSYATRCQQLAPQYEVIDKISSIFGSITEYLKGNTLPLRPLLFATDMPVMTILLVDSKQAQDPETQSHQMSQLMDILPETSMSIFSSIDLISKRAYNVFHQICETYQDSKLTVECRNDCILKQYNIIKHCIVTNQNLLHALNITHNRLDDICMIAQKHGMCGKYTDIGHGRYAYVWCPRHIDEPCGHVTLLVNELKASGYDVTETRLARTGVRIEQMPIEVQRYNFE